MKSLVGALIAATMLLVSTTANAAKCKFQDDSVDKFTKVHSMWTDWEPLVSTYSKPPEGPHEVYLAFVSAKFEGDDDYLIVSIAVDEFIPMKPPPYELKDAIVVPENSQLLILLADGTIVGLPVQGPHSYNAAFFPPGVGANTSKKEYWKNFYANITYTLDEETLAALTGQDATNIRIEAGDTYYDIDIHKKSMGDLTMTLECLQQARNRGGAAK